MHKRDDCWSEKPEVDGSTPSLTTTNMPLTREYVSHHRRPLQSDARRAMGEPGPNRDSMMVHSGS
jgi:hypothetical protein